MIDCEALWHFSLLGTCDPMGGAYSRRWVEIYCPPVQGEQMHGNNIIEWATTHEYKPPHNPHLRLADCCWRIQWTVQFINHHNMEVVFHLIRVYLWSMVWPIGNMWPSIQSATVYLLKYVPLSLFSLSGPTSACDALNWCFLEPSERPQWSSHTCQGEWL